MQKLLFLLIFSLLNKKQITKESFTPEFNGMHLTKKASQTIMKEMDLRSKGFLM